MIGNYGQMTKSQVDEHNFKLKSFFLIRDFSGVDINR